MPPIVMPNAMTDACTILRLLVTSGRIAVRRMRESNSRSITSLMAAVPPLTRPMPSSALNMVHDREEVPDLAAAKYAPHHVVSTSRLVTRTLISTE